jgi:hypothetical protein
MRFSKTRSMQFLANVARILPKKLLLLSPVVLLPLSIPFSVASSAKADDTTSVVCYFQRFDTTWQWGLNPDKSWYKLNGRWVYDGVHRFETSTNRDEIINSCRKAQEYYGHGDKRLINIYAANSSLGRNYVIYSNGGELKP